MKINKNDFRRIYKTSMLEKQATTRKKCPSKSALAAFFNPRAWMSRKRKLRVIDHVTSCAYCLREFEFHLETYRKQDILIQNINRVTPIISRFVWMRRYAYLAAGFLLIAFSSLFLIKPFPVSHGRGDTENTIALKHPFDQIFISAPLIFNWDAVSEAEYYILEIFDPDLLPFWRVTDIGINSYLLPQSILKLMKQKEPYYWMITVVYPEGSIQESRLGKFSISK